VPNLMELFGEISVFAKLSMAVSVGVFAVALMHVLRPTERKLALMRPLSLAAIFATLSGLLGGWIAVLGGIAATPSGQLRMDAVYGGIAATLTTGFVCFSFLAAAWVLIAAGMFRRGSAGSDTITT